VKSLEVRNRLPRFQIRADSAPVRFEDQRKRLPIVNSLLTAIFVSRASSAIDTVRAEKFPRQHVFWANQAILGAESASRALQKLLVTSRESAGEQASRDRVPIRACSGRSFLGRASLVELTGTSSQSAYPSECSEDWGDMSK
jgi:hypothetical protein